MTHGMDKCDVCNPPSPKKGEAREENKKVIREEMQLAEDQYAPLDPDPCDCDHCMKIPWQVWEKWTENFTPLQKKLDLPWKE